MELIPQDTAEGMPMDNYRTEYGSYWVAYFDLMGFESMVRGENAVGPIRFEVYEPLLTEIKNGFKEVECKWFSDTFLFYTPDHSRTCWSGISDVCESFFYRAIEQQIPVRGCLSIGDFYAEGDILVGPALIEAYRLAERQDWLGFVLSPKAVAKCNQYGIGRKHYREYDVPVHDGKSERLETFILSSCFQGCCPPHEWWNYLDEMEGGALVYIEPTGKRDEEAQSGDASTESERVLRKYRNSKKYLLNLYPQLADLVQGEYGSICLNKPEIKRKIRELSWRLT
jgi:hypothetical protein